jgi:hypothetical protein
VYAGLARTGGSASHSLLVHMRSPAAHRRPSSRSASRPSASITSAQAWCLATSPRSSSRCGGSVQRCSRQRVAAAVRAHVAKRPSPRWRLSGVPPPRQAGRLNPRQNRWDNVENTLWNSMERLARVGQNKPLIFFVIGCPPWAGPPARD